MDELIKAVRSLLSDIESMQPHCNNDNYWFGPFSEIDEYNNLVEWPNLAISAEDVKKALEAIKPV